MRDGRRLERTWAARDGGGTTRGLTGISSGRWVWQPEPAPWQIGFGLGWFVVQATAMWFGLWPLAIVFAVAGGLAAGQTARSWSSVNERADMALALLIGVLAPLAAATHTAAFGALMVAGAAVSILGASVQRGPNTPPLRDAGFTIQSWLPVAAASAGMVFAYRYEPGAAVWLLCMVSIYDTGHYLFGAGSDRGWEGPVAGMAGVGVVAFALVIVGVPPLDTSASVRFAAAATLLIPAGVVAASVVLPDPEYRAGALRRIDSLIIVAPFWAWSIGRYLTTSV